MKFTIIIPAYNSAEFINIPLDSLEKQTYQENFEVLIINDGSTDDIKKAVSPYLLRNQSWKLITKKNGNWGSVINFIKYNVDIMSEYITVLDSDDYFDEKMLEEVSLRTEDVVITGINKKFSNKEKKMPVYLMQSGNIKQDRAFTPVSTPHGKFYKKELWYKAEDLEQDVSYQDTVLFNDLINKSESIYYIKKPLATWWYDRPGNSTTVEWNRNRGDLWIETCQRVVDLGGNDESISWAIMYLWELNRQYGKETVGKVSMDVSKAKLLWLPYGLRSIAKWYFTSKIKKYVKKPE